MNKPMRLEFTDTPFDAKHALKLGGEDFYLAAGSFHYFRTLPGGWRKRLELMRDFGMTAVQTYVPWNLHEKNEGEFDFSGRLNLSAFLELCDEVGLKVMLRPAPYICSECDNGGLPWWLLKTPDIALRTSDPRYLAAVERYYKRLCSEFVPYLSTNGGPIIACVIENEYGSYGSDYEYLNWIKDTLTGLGVDVPFYTTDGELATCLKYGTLDGIWAAANYRSESKRAIDSLRKKQTDKPSLLGEFWNGRAIYWDQPYSPREVAPIAQSYKDALEYGGLCISYMFAGGTNFGFFNGANITRSMTPKPGTVERYHPQITSYDVNAPITEYGFPTPKYYAMRKALDEFLGKPIREEETPIHESQEILNIKLTEKIDLLDNIDKFTPDFAASDKKVYPKPPTFEELDNGYGYVLYTTQLRPGSSGVLTLKMLDLRDRATVYLDGKYIGTAMRDRKLPNIEFEVPENGARLDILVENMGRINFGELLGEHKGILGGVKHGVFLNGWKAYPIPMENLPDCYVSIDEEITERPTLYRAYFDAKAGVDTFVRLDGWHKGFVCVNGFNLGRYWKAGPQETLYLPGELLREEGNVIEVFEVHTPNADRTVSCVKEHTLDGKVGADDSELL